MLEKKLAMKNDDAVVNKPETYLVTCNYDWQLNYKQIIQKYHPRILMHFVESRKQNFKVLQQEGYGARAVHSEA